MLPSAYGLGQYFQDLGHSFPPYGPPSRQIAYIYIFHHSKDSSLFIKNLRKMCLLSRPEGPCSTDWENSIFFFEAVSVAQ